MKFLKNITLYITAGSVLLMAPNCSALRRDGHAIISKCIDFKTPSGIRSKDLASSIDKFMNKFIDKNISGAQVSVMKNGKEVFNCGYGLANRKKKLPVTTKTSFNYASASKMFIWVAAMQLSEQGKLDLKKDITTYLPEGYIKPQKTITFLNLMNHNAGFEAYWKYHEGSGESRDFSSLEEAVKNCYSSEQCFAPGKFQGYSNFGANLAALIIEKVSGVPFSEYVEKNIFKPCGMETCYPEIKPINNVMQNKAVGYIFNKGEFKVTPVYSGDWLYPSGSAVGTASDLSKFTKALMPKKGEKSPLFKNNKTLKKMLEISYTPTGTDLFSVHHGFWGTDGTYRGMGHTGCVDGMVSHVVFNPKENFSVAVLVNDENGWDIANGIVSLLTGSDYDKNYNKIYKTNLKALEGEYVHARTRFVGRASDFNIINVKKLSNNELEIKTGSNSEVYRQIGPYLFENTTAKNGRNFKSKMYFKVTDDHVDKIVTFKNDLIPISELKEFRK